MNKVNNCKNYKEVVELLDEVIGYYKMIAQEKHEINQQKMNQTKERRKEGFWYEPTQQGGTMKQIIIITIIFLIGLVAIILSNIPSWCVDCEVRVISGVPTGEVVPVGTEATIGGRGVYTPFHLGWKGFLISIVSVMYLFALWYAKYVWRYKGYEVED